MYGALAPTYVLMYSGQNISFRLGFSRAEIVFSPSCPQTSGRRWSLSTFTVAYLLSSAKVISQTYTARQGVVAHHTVYTCAHYAVIIHDSTSLSQQHTSRSTKCVCVCVCVYISYITGMSSVSSPSFSAGPEA